MDRTDFTEQGWTDLLERLRWHLVGLRTCGIESWLRPPGPQPAAADTGLPAEDHFPEAAALPDESASAGFDRLEAIRRELGDCHRCSLVAGRNKLVFGDGSPVARLVFVGEGPGADEDRQGLPFVGKAGKLLDKMIQSLGLRRQDVYICNVVKCRPPGNRTPQSNEIASCSPFLFRQLEAIQPRVICALGAPAAQTLLGVTTPISRMRGKTFKWRGFPLVATYHPAYLLRNSGQKAAVWQDLVRITELLELNPHEQ